MVTEQNAQQKQKPLWLILLLMAIGMILLVPLTWIFVSLTARPIHPDPQNVPSVSVTSVPPALAPTVERARQLALAHLVNENLPGLSVAVGIDGQVVWAQGFGYADLKAAVPVGPAHKFRIGAISESFTAAAAAQLIEKGQLKLDSEIQTYVPAFPRKQWPVTLRHLMNNSAGFPGGESLFTRHCEHPEDALPYFANAPLQYQPGTQTIQTPYGWILIAAAIEEATDQPFQRYMREQLFQPLNMRNTAPDTATLEAGEDFPLVNMFRELIHDPEQTRGPAPAAPAESAADRVKSYYPRFAKDPNYGLHIMRPLDFSCYAGSSNFLSTPTDIVRFAMATKSSQRDGHVLGGRVATLTMVPERNIAVAVTSNISHANTGTLASQLADTFSGLR